MTHKNIPGLIANAMEFRDQYIPNAEEKKVMQQLFKYDDMEDFKPPAKGGKDKYNRKIMLIIIAYMMRLEETKEKALQPALLSIIKLVPNLTEMLMDTASEI